MSLDALTQEVTLTPKGVKKTVRRIKRGLKDVDESAEDTTEQLDESTSRFERMGRTAKRWLAGVAAGAVTALAGVMAKATKEAATFEKNLREVATLLDGEAEGTLDRFASGIDRIRRQLPVTTDLTQALYDAISAGVDPDNAIAFLRTAAEASVAGVTDTRTAVDALTSALNAYDRELTEAEEISDSFFTAVEAGKTTFPELANIIGRVAPLAAQLGIDLDEVNAVLATLTKSGQDTSEAATALRGVLAQLVKNGQKFRDMGIQLNRVLAEEGLQGVLRRVKEETGGNTEAIQELFQDVEGLNAVLAVTGNQATQFADALQQMTNKSGATRDAVSEVNTGAAALWRTTKNRLTVAMRNLGERVLPTVNGVLRETNKLLSDAASTDLEQLLASIQRIEGLDAGVEMQLRTVINLRQAREQLRDAKDKLDEEFTVGVDLGGESEPSLLGRLLGDEPQQVARVIRKPLEELTRADLQKRLEAVNRALRVRAERIAELEDKDQDVPQAALRRRTLLQIAQQDLIEGLEVLSRYRAAQEAVADAQRRLGQTFASTEGSIQGALAAMEQMDLIQSPEELFPVSSGGGAPPAIPVVPEVDLDDGQVIRQTEEAAQKLSTALSKSFGELMEEDTLAVLGRRADRFSTTMNDLTLQLRTGAISQEEFSRRSKAAAQEFRQELNQLLERLREFGLLTPEVKDRAVAAFRRVERSAEGASDEIENAGEVLQDTARLVRGIGDVADAFGDISDEAREAIDATADVLDNVGRLVELSERAGGLGQLFSTASGALSGTLPIVGAIGGVVQLGASLFGDDDETLQRLHDSLRDNTRELAKNTQALLEEGQIGEDVSQQALDRAEEILTQLTQDQTLFSARFNQLIAELEGLEIPGFENIESLFSDLQNLLGQQFGIADPAFIRRSVADLLFGGLSLEDFAERIAESRFVSGSPEDVLEELQSAMDGEFQSFRDILDELEERLGTFSDSLSGAIEELELMQRFTDTPRKENFREFLEDVINLEGIEGNMRSFLRQIMGQDITTEQGRERLREIIQQIARGLAEGTLDVGGLSPNEVEQLLDVLRDFAEGDGGSPTGDQFTTSAAVSRTITEFQASQLLAFQQELVSEARTHGDLLASILDELGGDSADASLAKAARSGVSVPAGAMQAFEASLRNRQRGVRRNGQRARPIVVNSEGSSTTQTFNVHIDVSAQETPESIARKLDEAVGSFLNRRRR